MNNCHVWFSYFYYKTLILIFVRIHCPPVLVVRYICTWMSVVTGTPLKWDFWLRNLEETQQPSNPMWLHSDALCISTSVCLRLNKCTNYYPTSVSSVQILLLNVFSWLGIANSDILGKWYAHCFLCLIPVALVSEYVLISHLDYRLCYSPVSSLYLHLHLADAFIQSDLHFDLHSGYTCFVSMCVPWESNPQTLRC